jgi:hypothetical protein
MRDWELLSLPLPPVFVHRMKAKSENEEEVEPKER